MKDILFIDNYESIDYTQINKIMTKGIIKEKLESFGKYYLNVLNNYELIMEYLNNIIEYIKNDDLEDIFYIDLYVIISLTSENIEIDSIPDIFYIIQYELSEYLHTTQERLKRLERLRDYIKENLDSTKNILNEDDKKLKQHYIDTCKKNYESYSFYSKKDFESDIKKDILQIREKYNSKLNDDIKEYNSCTNDINEISPDNVKKQVIRLLENEKYFLTMQKNMLDVYNSLARNTYIEKFKFVDNNKSLLFYQGLRDYYLDSPRAKIYLFYEKNRHIYPCRELSLFSENFGKNFNTDESIGSIKQIVENNSIKKVVIYEVKTFKELLDIYLQYFITNNIVLKKCKNCGKYFIPHNKQVYCNNPSPQNPEKTCKLLSDDMRNNKNPIYEVYRSNYKTQNSKKRRNIKNIPNIEEKFYKWNEQAKEKMQECMKGELTKEEYKKWLKESQNWIKNY